jgi:hypothetical protein
MTLMARPLTLAELHGGNASWHRVLDSPGAAAMVMDVSRQVRWCLEYIRQAYGPA